MVLIMNIIICMHSVFVKHAKYNMNVMRDCRLV